jgi:hypothetical protein
LQLKSRQESLACRTLAHGGKNQAASLIALLEHSEKRLPMDQSDGQPHSRPWLEIAAEVANERDPSKLQQLTKELMTALDEQSPLCRKDAQSLKKPTPKVA